jgi:hypothetical protein
MKFLDETIALLIRILYLNVCSLHQEWHFLRHSTKFYIQYSSYG